MLPRDILARLKRLQLRARRAVENFLGGVYHSIFKGVGISFEEVREYQPGDDIRSIDWNVTARMGHPFIKRFVEERELTVLLAADISGSESFGTRMLTKREVQAELAALLTFSAIANQDRVGLITFGRDVEKFVPPRKGLKHGMRIIRDVLYSRPQKPGTSLQTALDYLNRVQRRRAIVFVLSDFLDTGFDKAMKRTAKRHDAIAVAIRDPREEALPAVGVAALCDAETGERVLVNTSNRRFREAYAAAAAERRKNLLGLFKSAGMDVINVTTEGGHVDALVRFFHRRSGRAS
jgi:uncharacterized protein (DUF58 family)